MSSSQNFPHFYLQEVKMSKVVHFEVMAEDPARATEFYSKVFGWEITKWDGPQDYWLVTTGAEDQPGINGGIAKSQGQAMTVNTVDVSSVDEFANKVEANGGKVVVPKMAVPGIGYLVYCQDTEGIVFGMMQADPSAK
jgi:predicted enzyme related to lactoylglutathione lyase